MRIQPVDSYCTGPTDETLDSLVVAGRMADARLSAAANQFLTLDQKESLLPALRP
jgi:hypothetical protein